MATATLPWTHVCGENDNRILQITVEGTQMRDWIAGQTHQERMQRARELTPCSPAPGIPRWALLLPL